MGIQCTSLQLFCKSQTIQKLKVYLKNRKKPYLTSCLLRKVPLESFASMTNSVPPAALVPSTGAANSIHTVILFPVKCPFLLSGLWVHLSY